MIPGALAVSAAALAGTPHCLGMCGGLAVAAGTRGGALPYHLGRIGTYAALGGLAGAFGAALPGPGWVPVAVSAVLLVGFSAALAGFLPEPKLAIPGLSRAGAWLARRSGPGAALGFGVVNGLLPCGLLYATLAVPAASGSAASGALLMALFGVWTSLPLGAAALGLRRVLAGRTARLALAGVVLITGLAGLAQRGAHASDEEPSCHSK